ncbi:hypothetical protein PYW08_012745 [Mythimna loreyi]|uniref:Uncharacterized protein n=1 Tax=Mythimna loreyi TaxID=667449 RepID=A0ACC2Q2X5_9NEOP|nr:hypothetical protein PYW08_012745 [Mythimna loreyi]
MRGLLEFTMEELISTQLLIGETFDKMHDLIENNLAELDELKEVYTQKSIDALNLLWKNFDDNNYLLIEAQVKENNYFSTHYFDKVKEEYLSMLPLLRQFIHAELPKENNPEEQRADMPGAQRDTLISQQRLRFKNLEEEIKGINIDSIRETNAMEDCQKILMRQWKIIEKSHKIMRENSAEMWPELTYELDYVQYKNMYETTYSLFNYKIDASLYPVLRVIPHIGIPTWRMFDNESDVHPFAVNSVAWRNFDYLGDVIRNNKISEGERRQLLIRTFLTYQNDDEPVSSDESVSELEDSLEFHNAYEEPLLLPLVDEID